MPLGIMPESEYESGEVTLEAGDTLVLYSDGITEAGVADDRAFGEERLVEVVETNRGRPLLDIQSHVLDAVRVWSGDENEAQDDMTLVLVRAKDG